MAVLESKLIIGASDETEAAFASVMKRIEAVSAKVAQINRVAGPIGATVASVNRAIAARGTGSLPSPQRLGAFGATAMGLGGVYGAGQATRAVAAAIGARQHEGARMDIAGETPAEIADAAAQAARLATEFPNVAQADLMHMLRNARSIVGSYKEAADIAEPLVKLRTLAQLARPGEDVTEDFDQLIKGLEIKGVTQHPEQFREYMEGIAKAINVFGDTLKPYQYYEMFKYGRQATQGLSEQFILGTAPTLAQELGGEGLGAAVSQFNKLLVSGVGKKGSFDELARLGLIDKDAVADIPGTGEGQGLKAGRKVKGWQEAQSDPYKWVSDFLMPALDRAGIKDNDAILKEVGTLFQSGRASQLVDLLATQKSRIDKDYSLIGNAPGLSAANKALHEDPGLAWSGLKNAVSGLVGAVGESIGAAGVMTGAAQWISGATADITKETAAAAKGDGWRDRAHFDALAKQSLWGAGYRYDDLERELDREHFRALGSGARAPLAFVGPSEWETRAGALTLPAQPARAPLALPQPAPQGPQNVKVDGEARIDHELVVRIEASPLLQAIVDQARQQSITTIPLLGGGNGRMDSDAGSTRAGGIGSM